MDNISHKHQHSHPEIRHPHPHEHNGKMHEHEHIHKADTHPRTPNPLHLERLSKFINEGPYLDLLSMQLVDLGCGYAEVELELQKKHFNPLGGVHGGVYASLIDSAAFWAAYCDLDEGLGFTTLDVHVTYVAPAKSGKLLARGKLIKMGKTLGLAECQVVEESGKIIAYGTSQLMVIKDFRLLDPKDVLSLPPKFIDA